MTKHKCPVCGSTKLTFRSSMGAPGRGQNWQCECGENLILLYGEMRTARDVDPSEVVYSPEEVR